MIDKTYLSQLEQQFGLPTGLLSSQMQAESGGNAQAVSPKGALGLFQFMPDTAKQYGIDPTDPEQAAQGAARMDSDLLKKYNGDVPSALAAYNWGQGNVDRQGLDNAPPETRGYISKIMSGIGNAIIPSAQAAESGIPEGFVPEDQSPKELASLPADQQVQSAPLSSNPDAVPEGFVPEQDTHAAAVAQNVAEMGQGLTGAAKQLGAYGLNALGGATANYADEGISALGALAKQGQGQDFSSRYGDLQQRQQAFREAGQQLNPEATALGQISGALIATPALTKLMPGTAAATIPGAIAKGAISGATYGGLSGSGEGDSFQSGQDSAKTRLENAKSGGEVGAALGGALGAVSGTAQKILAPAAQTSQDVRAAASQAYKTSEDLGGVMTKDFSNKFINEAEGAITEPSRVTEAFGQTPVQKIVQGIKDKFENSYMTLKEATSIDKRLGQAIDDQILPTGKPNEIGMNLMKIQDKFRELLKSASENGQIAGGPDGVAAWKEAQQLWSQQAKMGDIERIIAKGQLMDNPATSIRSGFRTLQKNPSRFNQYTPEQKALINQAGKAGLTQEALRALSSRLLSISATGLGAGAGFAGGGPIGAIAGGVTADVAANVVGGAARKLSGSIQAARGQKVIDAIAGNKRTVSTSKPLIAGTTQATIKLKEKK